ncbi:MAG: TonB-dependent receptor [Flavobacteriales bacterium]|nr:TonB-dependent receptor [Flavobacteriales bacterium]
MLFFSLRAEAQCILTITDEQGEALPGVSVIWEDGEAVRGVSSNEWGQVEIPESWYATSSLIEIEVQQIGSISLHDSIQCPSRRFFVLKKDPMYLNEVVITGQYGVSDQRSAVHRVEVIDEEELDRISTSDISDILQHSGELQIRRNGVIGTGINIQGLGDRNVKVTINEVPVVGRVDGKLDLDQLDVQDIERIEIVKGPMAVSYGTDAIAGVINIITKKAVEQQDRLQLRGYYSSEGQYDAFADWSSDAGKYDYRLKLGRRYFDGWSPSDPFFRNQEPVADDRRNSLWNPKEQYLAGLVHGLDWKRTRLEHRLDIMDETLKDRGAPEVNEAAETIQAFDTEYHTLRIDNSLRYSHDGVQDQRFKGFLSFNYFDRVRKRMLTDVTDLSRLDLSSDTTDYLALSTRHTWTGSVHDRVDFQVGWDGSWEQSTGQRIDGTPELFQAAGFASLEWKLSERWLLRPGLRYGYHELFAMPFIPSIALRYRKNEHTWRLSVGQGFRAPDFKELYLAFYDANHNVYGNEDLRPESSLNLNAAYNYSRTYSGWQIEMDASLFYNDVDDLIALAQVGEASSTSIPPYSYLNLDEVITQGTRIDLGLTKDNTSVRLGWGLTGREDITEGQVLTPMNYFHQVNSSLSHRFEKLGLTCDIMGSYNGAQTTVILQEDEEEVLSFYQEEYFMVDLALGKEFFDRSLTLRTGVRNLLDISVINAGSTLSGHSGGSTSVPIGTGRNVFISLDYTLDRDARK